MQDGVVLRRVGTQLVWARGSMPRLKPSAATALVVACLYALPGLTGATYIVAHSVIAYAGEHDHGDEEAHAEASAPGAGAEQLDESSEDENCGCCRSSDQDPDESDPAYRSSQSPLGRPVVVRTVIVRPTVRHATAAVRRDERSSPYSRTKRPLLV